MKRPKRNDQLKIKDGQTINLETCYTSDPDPVTATKGVKITIATKRHYEKGRQYFIVSGDHEVAASVEKVQEMADDTYKRVVFFTTSG